MAEGKSGAKRPKITFSQSDRANIALAVLCDCINGFGLGLRAFDDARESSWTQGALHSGVPQLLREDGAMLGLSKAEIAECERIATRDFTPESIRSSSVVIAAALFARFHLLGLQHPEHEDFATASDLVAEHAAIAIGNPGHTGKLFSVAAIGRAVDHSRGLPGGLSWRSGVTAEDVHSACCRWLLGRQGLMRAQNALILWIRALVKESSGGSSEEGARVVLQGAMNKLVNDWMPTIINEPLDAIVDHLNLLSSHETDCVFPLDCDPMCSVLGIPHAGSTIELRDGRQLVIGPLSHMNTLFRPDDEEADHAEDEEVSTGPIFWGDKRLRGLFDSVQPIGHCRALVVWRGSPATIVRAQQQLPRVLRSALRTAVMSQNISEGLLETAVSPYFMSSDHDMRYANIADYHKCLNIDKSPSDFPVCAWLALVLDESLLSSKGALAFAGNASRLLLDADDLLDAGPQQSFVCSMSAIEACLGSKGEAISVRLSRALARLLCPDVQTRPNAEVMLKGLYDIRSQVVHGTQVAVSRREAVFMRFVASCAVYNLVGFAKSQISMGVQFEREQLQSFLGEKDVYSSATIPGTTTCPLLQALLKEPEVKLRGWVARYT